jgi:single-strand DNA-binding protein
MNKVLLVGNLTKDPELTTTTNGVSVCKFTLAVSRRFVGASGERETDFLNIVVWRGQAENCHKYLKKGSKCGVVGTIQSRSYDAQDGTKRYITEIIADEVEFLSSKNSEPMNTKAEDVKVEEVTELKPIDDDTLPF